MERVEQWLRFRGVPHAMQNYQATTSVFTRMLPFFALLVLLSTFTTFGSDSPTGVRQAAAFVGAWVVLLALIAGANRIAGRRPFQQPTDVGLVEVAFFLTVGPVVALIFADDRRVATALGLLVTNVLLTLIGYAVTSYAVFPMIRWGARQMVREISGLAGLLARTLPLLLLFATFLFINAEMWQVAHDITGPYYAIVVGTLLVAAVGFLAMRLPTEMETLQRFESWDEVTAIAADCDAPVADLRPCWEQPREVAFGRGERLNVVLLMLTAKLVQMVLVGTMIGLFYVAFGLLTVRSETLVQWTEIQDGFVPLAEWNFLGDRVVLTRELLEVSGFIAAITALQFAVSLITDDVYRAEFNSDLEEEIREVFAVRSLYLAHLGD